MIKYGDVGSEVIELQQILRAQGYYDGPPDGKFGERTREALFWFQATHIDQNHIFLDADCVVGPKTWWALRNPSGDPQVNKIDPIIPSGLSEDRKKVLQIAVSEYKKGVKEVPDGSNWGPEIKKYGGRPGWAWCALFMNWCFKQALGKYPTGKLDPSCYQNWKAAEKLNIWKPKKEYAPIPGDAFIMQYKDTNGRFTGKGHTGIVLRISEDGRLFNAIEGNTSNRVKVTLRDVSSTKLIGYINPYTTPTGKIEFGVIYGNITPEDLNSTR